MSKFIKESLKEARRNMKPLKEVTAVVSGEILESVQVGKRCKSVKTHSELSVVRINNDSYFLVTHRLNGLPAMEDIYLNKKGDFKAYSCIAFCSEVITAMSVYRLRGFDEKYVNTYSYLWGYLISKGYDLKTTGLF